MRATATIIGGLAAVVAVGWAPVAPAHAAGSAAWECTHAGGVWVTVQVRGAQKAAGCYTGGGTGLDALRSVTTVQQKSNGLICGIAGYAGDGGQLCKEWDSTQSPYWFYFLKVPADAGWQFSNIGAQNRRVVPGSIEGWNFGTGLEPFDPPVAPALTAPAAAPPPPAAPNPPTATSPRGSSDGGSSAGSGGNAGSGGAGSGDSGTTGNSASSGNGGSGTQPATGDSPGPGQPAATTVGPDGQQTPVPATPDAGAASPTPGESASPGTTATTASASPAGQGTGRAPVAGPAATGAPAKQQNSPVGLFVTLGVLALAALGGGSWWYVKARRSL